MVEGKARPDYGTSSDTSGCCPTVPLWARSQFPSCRAARPAVELASAIEVARRL